MRVTLNDDTSLSYRGRCYDPGETADLPKEVALQVIAMGHGKAAVGGDSG